MHPGWLLLLAGSPPLAAQAPFCDHIRALTQAAPVASAHWGISVTTLAGEPVCAINDRQLFRPASNAKLFTSAAALALLGPTYTVTTKVTAEAPKGLGSDPAELDGSVRIHGAGDANLSTRPLPYTYPKGPDRPDPLTALADQIAATGLRHVTGNVLGMDTLWPAEPYPPDWANGDLSGGEGAPVTPLAVYDNMLKITVSPGTKPGSAASVTLTPATTHFSIRDDVTTVTAKAKAAAGLQSGSDSDGPEGARVFGTVAMGQPFVTDVAIRNPALFAAATLQTLLEARGVHFDRAAGSLRRDSDDAQSFSSEVAQPLPALSDAAPAAAAFTCPQRTCRVIASHTSAALREDVTLTLKVSENLHAELLLHQLALAFGDQAYGLRGSRAQGARVVRQFLLNAGIAQEEFYLNDGSGMSTHDLITPHAATQLLAYAATQAWFVDFKAALPVGGTDGTLTARFTTALKGKVNAKTGTLGESRALSGFVTTASGQTLIFSVLVDTHLPGSVSDRPTMDKIVETIAAEN